MQIGDKEFYFLLPVRSILGGPLGPRHHHVSGGVVPYQSYHSGGGSGSGKKSGRSREFYEEDDEEEDEEDVRGSGKKARRDGHDEYASTGITKSLLIR